MSISDASLPVERTILENLTSAVMVFDSALRLIYTNASGEMLFSISVRNMLGEHAEALFQCPDGTVQSCLGRAHESGRPFTQREMCLRLPDGREIIVDCSMVPLRDSDFEGGILVELNQLDRQLRINKEELLLYQHQAARALVRALAHEIKNPLGGLRGAAQLLEQELPEASLREYTQIIIEEADRLKALVNRMLGPNRLPNFGQTNIHQLLERVRNLVQVEAGERIRITRDYDPSIPLIYADADRLIQALLNIVRNAAQAVGEEGTICFRSRILRQFTIGPKRHRLVIQVEIIDDGPGISEELQNQIFYPMVTGQSGGMGLGLSIAQSLVTQHGGLIECRSKPGETVFSVLIPLENSHE